MGTDNIYENGTYSEINPTWHSEHSLWKAKQIAKSLSKYEIKPTKVAEIGCGAGGIILELSKLLESSVFTGFDISPQAYEISKKLENERVKFVLGDFFSIQNEEYDLMICADVFEHVDDYLGFLRALSKSQKMTIFHIPLDLSVISSLLPGILIRTRNSVGHLHYFNKSTAEATLLDSGFKIIDSRITEGCLEFPEPGVVGRIFWTVRKVTFALSPKLAAQIFGGFSLMVLASSES
jgi:SAM-dependent methyltransferase